MNEYDDIKEQALSLPDGTTMQGKCPWCGRDDSFYITRSGSSILFIDHSVRCRKRGAVNSRSGDWDTDVAPVVKPPKLFKGELTSLTWDEQLFFWRKFQLGRSVTRGMRFCPEDDRVYFPQHDRYGAVVGYIARYYPELTDKKQYGGKALWKAVKAVPDLQLYFPSLDVLEVVMTTRKVVLVEDYVSARRITYQLGVPCCALGGTALLDGHIKTLIDMGITDVSLVLDGDAVVKAVKLKRSMSLAFNVNLLTLSPTDPDPKDMGHDELENKLGKLRCWHEGE